jgi:hypothetical protein
MSLWLLRRGRGVSRVGSPLPDRSGESEVVAGLVSDYRLWGRGWPPAVEGYFDLIRARFPYRHGDRDQAEGTVEQGGDVLFHGGRLGAERVGPRAKPIGR